MIIFLALILILFNVRHCDHSDWTQLINSNYIQYTDAQGELCLDGLFENYNLKSAVVQSMGIQVKDNKWIRDSDFDGLNDDEENELKLNPRDARSTEYILDSLCVIYLKPEECLKFNTQLNCKNKPFGFGLNDCDQEFITTQSKNSVSYSSIDSDHDDVIDYLEIINHLNPNFVNQEQELFNLSRREKTPFSYFNRFNIRDGESDSVSVSDMIRSTENYNENKIESNEDKKLVIKFEKIKSTKCKKDAWAFKVKNIPWYISKSPIQEGRQNTDPVLSINSLKNESIAVLYFKLMPLELVNLNNTLNSKKELILFQKIKLDLNSKTQFYQTKDFIVLE